LWARVVTLSFLLSTAIYPSYEGPRHGTPNSSLPVSRFGKPLSGLGFTENQAIGPSRRGATGLAPARHRASGVRRQGSGPGPISPNKGCTQGGAATRRECDTSLTAEHERRGPCPNVPEVSLHSPPNPPRVGGGPKSSLEGPQKPEARSSWHETGRCRGHRSFCHPACSAPVPLVAHSPLAPPHSSPPVAHALVPSKGGRMPRMSCCSPP
jgi:hypothetical protein